MDAVRHDGERIPEEVQSGISWAKQLLADEYYANNRKKQKQLIERLLRYFAKDIKVAEKTIEKLKALRNTEYTD